MKMEPNRNEIFEETKLRIEGIAALMRERFNQHTIPMDFELEKYSIEEINLAFIKFSNEIPKKLYFRKEKEAHRRMKEKYTSGLNEMVDKIIAGKHDLDNMYQDKKIK